MAELSYIGMDTKAFVNDLRKGANESDHASLNKLLETNARNLR